VSDLDQRLDTLIQKRKKLQIEIERLRGRKEQAQENLKAIEEECRSKKIDPNNIDDTIQQLETKYEKLILDLESDVANAEQALSPFVTGGSNTHED
jgi:predicted nuclease with TOPRIM domain